MRGDADLVELAEDWLATKTAGSRASNPDKADAARRGDLARWGRAIQLVRGGTPAERPNGALDLAEDLGPVTLADLSSVSVLVRALAVLRTAYAPASCRRMLATLRTFSRWLVKRGHLGDFVADDDQLVVPHRAEAGATPVHAFDLDEVAAMIEAAAEPPPGLRSAWPARDVALLRVLEGCGLRAAEAVSLHDVDVDRSLDRAMLRVSRGTKGSKLRNVPVPSRTMTAIEAYVRERLDRVEHPAGGRLFVRPDGRPVDVSFLDRLIRRVAHQAHVTVPSQACAHGFRHHYGVQLAFRRVPIPVIQELMGHADPRTTSIYMKMAGSHLTDALDDAGWLA